jgi:transcriptional regulator with XRE-family HTH domain
VREARKNNGWSQRTFGFAMGCSQQYVDQVEKGDKKLTLKMREFLLSVSATKQTTCEKGSK